MLAQVKAPAMGMIVKGSLQRALPGDTTAVETDRNRLADACRTTYCCGTRPARQRY
jgi:hypothetical protein